MMQPPSGSDVLLTGYTDQRKVKLKHQAIVSLSSGEKITGFLFTAVRQRLIDLLNDQREFIPFETEDGDVLIVAKKNIEFVKDDDKRATNGKTFSQGPYEVLGLSSGVSYAEVRNAFREIANANNPENLRKMGADETLLKQATTVFEKARQAFQEITKEFQSRVTPTSQESIHAAPPAPSSSSGTSSGLGTGLPRAGGSLRRDLSGG
jgi:hypothetical protein